MSKPDPKNAFKELNRMQELAGLDQDKSSIADIGKEDFDDLKEFVDFVRKTLRGKGKSDGDLVHELAETVDSDQLWEALDRVAKENKLYYYADKNSDN